MPKIDVSPALQSGVGALKAKLADAQTIGYLVEMDPEEAEQAGAFVEDALSEADAADSSVDLAVGTTTALLTPTSEGA